MYARRTFATVLFLIFIFGNSVADEGEYSLYWGDTHLHTSNSPDAYLQRNRSADPDTAYRFAQGLPVIHPYSRARVRLQRPLDFLVVADHAEYLGVLPALADRSELLLQTSRGRAYADRVADGELRSVFFELFRGIALGDADEEMASDEVVSSMWAGVIDAAERHNKPGVFTTFIGWEWSSNPDGDNLHRVIFTPDGAKKASTFLPFSAFDSMRPEDLWQWLDETSQRTGVRFLSIPHNSNLSGGRMFDHLDSAGRPFDLAYARNRRRWEPVIEVTQSKGDSETHPELSPTDEFAAFERYQFRFGSEELESAEPANYVRSALLRGLQFEVEIGANPYQSGLIGSTDMHSGLASTDEDNFLGKFALDGVPETSAGTIIRPLAKGFDVSASGLAAVWAEDNTREAIFDAFQRREVYGTTGPRIQLRFFGGWNFKQSDADAHDIDRVGRTIGVPMGSELTAAPANGRVPQFLLQAVQDPLSARLDRIQVVKGWVDSHGVAHEKIFDVVWSGGRAIGDNSRPEPIADTVNRETASFDPKVGATQLVAVWEDPSFDPAQHAFYYARVIQAPTPRHSLLDAIALQINVAVTGQPASIQERAYSSPIWYVP